MPKVSSKNQITIPVDAMREAGIEPGDNLAVRVTGHGQIVVETLEARLAKIQEYADRLAGVYEPGYLDKLRDEWEH